jgi:hypothetical protein
VLQAPRLGGMSRPEVGVAAPARNPHGMEPYAERASFRGDDDPALVAAALACPVCLSGDVSWALEVDEWEAQVECSCQSCGHRREVGLNSQQALRLYLHRSRPLVA